ncbi:hypothetical protein [Flavobacterium sp.]|jgi:hypothetical protein|uniref:hypothetical protein n=1 Tax=Flavobacterium sp. TaxID=239 RepID=UPI0037C04798
MSKKYLLLLVLFSGCFLQAQELFFSNGKNFTKYDYKNSLGNTNSSLRSGEGSFYQLGLDFKLNKATDKLSYAVSVVYNQFNAEGGTSTANYSWKTNYLGVQNALNYTLFQNSKSFKVKTKLGVATSTIIKGEQYINNVVFDITNNEEFKGITIQPNVGVDFQYAINQNVRISAGYEFSKAFNVSNSSSEELSFTNNQIHFGLHFPLK